MRSMMAARHDGSVTGLQTDTETTAGARTASRRIVGVDIARALALLGMMSTHILSAYAPPDFDTVSWHQSLAGGRSAALFATLAGVSLALVTGRSTRLRGRLLGAVRAGVVARAAVIGVIGLILGSFDSGIAVILAYYAVLFLLAVPFLGLGWRALATLALGWAVVGPVLSHLVRPSLPAPTYDIASVEQLFAAPLNLVSELLVTGYYPSTLWLAYIFAGMAVGRLSLDKARVAHALVGVGAVLAAAAWAVSWFLVYRAGGYEVLERTLPPDSVLARVPLDLSLQHGFYGTTPTTSWWWLTVVAPHSSTPFDFLHTIGTSLLVLGLALLVGRLAGRVLGIVFAAGAMTLTLYSAHVFALAAQLGPERGPTLYAWHVGIALLFGAVWRAAYGSGPLERVTAMASAASSAAVRALPTRSRHGT